MVKDAIFVAVMLLLPALCFAKELDLSIPQEFNWEQIEADSKLLANTNNKYNLDLEFIEPADKRLWVIFTALNVADIYTTHRALKFSCVEEANPLLGTRPTLARMVVHKTVLLWPIYDPDWNRYPPTDRDLEISNWLLTAVVYNNYRVLKKVEKYPNKCPKVGTV